MTVAMDPVAPELMIDYADSQLRAFPYLIAKQAACLRKYEELTCELEASLVSSPRIKSTEEAKYKSSPRFTTGGLADSIMDILDRREEVQHEYDVVTEQLHTIGEFLRRLSPEEVESVYRRYEWHQPLRSIAHATGVGVETARRRIISALCKW